MAESFVNEVRQLLPRNVCQFLPDEELDPALLYLLKQSEEQLFREDSSHDALQYIEAVVARTWEVLNTGHWSEVPEAPRQLYTAAALLKVFALLQRNQLQEALKTADLALMLGAPLPKVNLSMTRIAHLLSQAVQGGSTAIPADASCLKTAVSDAEKIPGVKGKAVLSLEKPSLEKFRREHFVPRVPVKLTSCMSHWPACEHWKDLDYLKRVAGARTVPVELGVHYVDADWSQKLMTVGEFIEKHVLQTDGTTTGYLAQHPLFEQVPELRGDISEPEYCCLSDNLDDSSSVEDTDINAWFGPGGTLSPLHQDPKHNLLAQVVGEKRILLYSPDDSDKLYPHEGSMLSNTAQVNPENPDYKVFPEYKNATAWECHLRPGEMLYIPPKWWHHVRALSTSFSVSFWWC